MDETTIRYAHRLHRHRHPRLTGYRILVVALTAGFGFFKALLSYLGKNTAPNTLDWMYGVVVFLLLYWMGIYEKYTLHNVPWLFEWDYMEGAWRALDRHVGNGNGSVQNHEE
ncbi:hypothetical protein BDQ17DRAFT_1430493 [Cyathus striatus]|nr:hypothetical protein BDQ17DRAFT_1430493 [Cyathus striatus]